MVIGIEKELGSLVSSRVERDVYLAPYTTFGVGGRSQYFCLVKSRVDLHTLLRWHREFNLPLLTIGNGSNLLIREEGFPGLTIRLGGELRDLRCERKRIIACGGVSLARLLEEARMNSLSGLEALSGIPGTVGGAVVMNAGTAHGRVGDCMAKVELMDGEGVRTFLREDLEFSYRRSSINPDREVVVEVEFNLKEKEKNEIGQTMKMYLEEKRESQPLNMPSAGCVFKNPPGGSASKLIDEAGLKGLRRGGAQVSPRHANFIVNTGGATPDDILYLIHTIQGKVYQKFGVFLHLEIKIV
ncbi:MAG TPA: UDP-N-acetylmuramate dehydrogenase [Candidatus Omnitrophica bacterium]|nr:UDP-N-acetylmuramate dehydrogenase [Candidatus Omnitrophota bacterium]